jgi:hypothetical protein
VKVLIDNDCWRCDWRRGVDGGTWETSSWHERTEGRKKWWWKPWPRHPDRMVSSRIVPWKEWRWWPHVS